VRTMEERWLPVARIYTACNAPRCRLMRMLKGVRRQQACLPPRAPVLPPAFATK